MSAKILFNYGRLPKTGSELKRGYLFKWGVRKASKRIAGLARKGEVKFEISNIGLSSLERKLRNLGVLSIIFPKGSTAQDVKNTLRSFLGTPSGQIKDAYDRDFSHSLIPSNYEFMREELENKEKDNEYMAYLQSIFDKTSLFDNEKVSDLVALFPRHFVQEITGTREWKETVVTVVGPPGSGARYLEEDKETEEVVRTESYSKKYFIYTDEQISFINKFLDKTGLRKEDVLGLLQNKNLYLHNALTGKPQPQIPGKK